MGRGGVASEGRRSGFGLAGWCGDGGVAGTLGDGASQPLFCGGGVAATVGAV